MAEIKLSTNEFKALASETRVHVLKLLKERNYTLSELSEKIGISSPSMKQQLELLVEADLVEKEESERKWKYYFLTRKGKQILEGEESNHNVLIILSMASIALIGIVMLFVGSMQTAMYTADISPVSVGTFGEVDKIEMPAIDELERKETEKLELPEMKKTAIETKSIAKEIESTASADVIDEKYVEKKAGVEESKTSAVEKNQYMKETKTQKQQQQLDYLLLAGVVVISIICGYFFRVMQE